MRNRKRTPLEERFWNHVQKTDSCWLWTGATRHFGYGVVNVNGRALTTHRVSWEMHNGPIPTGMVVCHKCDTPACVRPDHLFLGTIADNNLDMREKGRASGGTPAGEDHPQRKLTDAQSAEMKTLYATGKTSYQKLARQYGVSHQTVKRHVNPTITPQARRLLTAAEKAAIRAAYTPGKVSYKDLAERYGVSITAIWYHVKHG